MSRCSPSHAIGFQHTPPAWHQASSKSSQTHPKAFSARELVESLHGNPPVASGELWTEETPGSPRVTWSWMGVRCFEFHPVSGCDRGSPILLRWVRSAPHRCDSLGTWNHLETRRLSTQRYPEPQWRDPTCSRIRVWTLTTVRVKWTEP